MIRINLLPEALRKRERMPLPHFLGVVGGVIVFGLLLYTIAMYEFDVIPALKIKRNNLQDEHAMLKIREAELNKINAEIALRTEYVETVKTLYRNRIIWANILYNFKQIINRDPTMNEYNAGMRYLWLVKFSGKGKSINLEGFATDANQVAAMQMPASFFEGIRLYSPTSMPEKNEEERLSEELRVATARYEALRRDNPDLPPEGPNEMALRERLEEIRKIKSGEIAMQPLYTQLVPGSLQLLDTKWTGAPQPRGMAAELSELFPKQAWSFKASMELK